MIIRGGGTEMNFAEQIKDFSSHQEPRYGVSADKIWSEEYFKQPIVTRFAPSTVGLSVSMIFIPVTRAFHRRKRNAPSLFLGKFFLMSTVMKWSYQKMPIYELQGMIYPLGASLPHRERISDSY